MKKINSEEIINSLDGLQRATAPDFFYTRLRAKMEKGIEAATPQPAWYFRPVYVMAVLMIVLAVNAVVFFTSNIKKESTASLDYNELSQQTIVSDFSQADNNIYDLTSAR